MTTLNVVQVTTPWNGDGLSTRTAFRPAVADDHPVASWVDVTGANPHSGGTYTVQVVCDAATLASIQSDPKYAGKTQLMTVGVTHGS